MQEDQMGAYNQAKRTAVYKVRKSDLLQINVKSLDPNTSTQEFFMGETGSGIAQGGASGSGSPQLFMTSYLVDEKGMIDLPIIGKLKAEGKTLDQIAQEIESEVKQQAKYSKVSVKLSNFRVNVIGEVNIPGTQYIFDTDYTLFHALANAGDLTDFADRTRVRLLRNIEGQTKSFWFDLTDPNVLSSDHLFLLPGDMILVDPLKAKINRNNAQNLTIGISVVSLLVTIISVTSR
ncbi:polysaccharide biosynthesis/export family protein [Roseivirga sp. E12]|uniref:polysaccharide biosynthesis/export family protein n=1 Tax=Roseivirga sp. E12 TaxID=2819237 RepID=UPI001ABD3EEF|nr:polysaccharide biosynthesis/export family protein [Roseivirga sp. E12]MBO3699088.1 polysaccharide biosynthesis/export family protein [Roseivirga sp. E12]